MLCQQLIQSQMSSSACLTNLLCFTFIKVYLFYFAQRVLEILLYYFFICFILLLTQLPNHNIE